jgi:hypothetical protein
MSSDLGGRMLIYHPFQDANHCVFRTLLLLEHSVHNEIDIELYRLLDFYILFPHLLKSISPLPVELRAYKRLLAKIPDPFESMLNTKRIIHELESLQTVALHNLLAKKLIDIDSFKSKKIKRTDEALPERISVAISKAENASEEWFRIISNELPLVNFNGKNGLKKRAGLMEFRYDLESL